MRTVAVEVFRCVHKLNPDYLHNMFALKPIRYCLRNENIMHVYKYKTKKYGFSSFSYQGAKLWNSLPNSMKCENNFKTFYTMLNYWNGQSCVCNICPICTMYNM